jgi:hypothetical protein
MDWLHKNENAAGKSQNTSSPLVLSIAPMQSMAVTWMIPFVPVGTLVPGKYSHSPGLFEKGDASPRSIRFPWSSRRL